MAIPARRRDGAVKILCVSDMEAPQLLSTVNLRRQYGDVDLIVSCGDMSSAYLDFISTIISVPMFYVRGNHDKMYDDEPPGGIDLHRQVVHYCGLTLAGLEGSIRYNGKGVQYTQSQMHRMVAQLGPRIAWHRLRGGGIDLFVTHSPARDIHDGRDYAHQGFGSFLNFMKWYRPRYMLHGHVHTWDRRRTVRTRYGATCVININPFTVLELEPAG